MVVQKNTERNSETFVRSDQDGIYVKIDGARGKQSMEYFGVKGRSGGGLR